MKGKLIIFEGSDGSGKETQSNKIVERLLKENIKVRRVDFPNYESDSSALVKMYLRGDFGDKAGDVNAYASSSFYGVDRFASYRTNWKAFYEEGGIIIADRYTTSNMIHQASKITDLDEKDAYLEWLCDFEFNKLELPEPDEVMFLNIPPDYTLKLMAKRQNKITGEAEKDIHEKDENYLRATYENARYIVEKYNWKNIECIKDDGLRSIEDIHEEVYNYICKVINRD